MTMLLGVQEGAYHVVAHHGEGHFGLRAGSSSYTCVALCSPRAALIEVFVFSPSTLRCFLQCVLFPTVFKRNYRCAA